MNARVRRGGPLLRCLVATAIGLGLGAGALIWTRTELTSLRYERADLLDRKTRLRKEVEKLRVESAVLTTPGRIERRALALGLRYPQPGQVIRPGVASGGPR